jgi:phospholipase/lecithinase/hemolysin
MSARRQLLTFAAVVAAGMAACAVAPPSAPIQRLVVVGDSNVDDGNLLRLTGNKIPGPPNWRGRNSNGPNIADYLARGLGVTMRNVAVSGATSGTTNIIALAPAYKSVEFTGVAWQIDQLEKEGVRLSQSDLVLLWTGSNDIFGASRSDRTDLDQRIAQSVRDIERAVERLHTLGARRFVIGNRTPRESLGIENDQNGVDLNAAMIKTMQTLSHRMKTDIRVFDAYASIAHMMRNPAQYGFTEVAALCRQVPVCADEKYDAGQPLASKYINWDAAHKTTRVHKLMADQVQQMLRQ